MQDWREMWPGNEIHPTAVICPSVQMGAGNVIGPYTIIGSDVVLGNCNRITGHASIGSPPEHKGFWSKHDSPAVRIGSGNVIREFTTINSGTARQTAIGDNCVMLRGSHHSHDSILEDWVTLSCNVLVGGHSHIMEGANCGLGSIIHQYQVIGAYAMLGMGTIVPKHVSIFPGYIYVGNPARELKRNVVGLERGLITKEKLVQLMERYRELRRQ